MKIQKVVELVANLHDKVICYIQKKFKTNILSWIKVFKRVHEATKLIQDAWSKPYMYMNIMLRKNFINNFAKTLFQANE